MKRSRIISFSFAIIFIVVAETNAGGNGCSWSGCQHFTSSTCGTGLTGGSGRHFFIKSKSCELIGRKDFCCDGDCGWRAYGTTCEQLNENSYTNEVGSANSAQQFCCPSNARPNNGFKTNDGGVSSVNEGSGFRSGSEGGGFRSGSEGGIVTSVNQDAGSGFRSGSEGGGFRSGSEGGNVTSTNQDAGVKSALEEGGVRSANGGGGFRSG